MSRLIDHAKREFLKLGYKPIEDCDDDPNKWMQENILELLEVFSTQGHSGSSAPYVIDMFMKLAAFEPIGPILCTDDEWSDISDNSYQNTRCSAVFKDGLDGKPYYLDAIVWKNQNNDTFTGNCVLNSKNEKISSRQNIKLPFNPKTFYIDVVEYEITPNNFESRIKDESQLKEVWKYYEKQYTLQEKRYKKLKVINDIL